MSHLRNATFTQLAEQVGATEAEVANVPPKVRTLTKGDLIDLWGARDTNGAIFAYQHGESQHIPEKAAAHHLNLQDIASIQSVFSPARVAPLISEGAPQPGDLGAPEGTSGPVNIYCCCCPCCCAATSLKPIKRL